MHIVRITRVVLDGYNYYYVVRITFASCSRILCIREIRKHFHFAHITTYTVNFQIRFKNDRIFINLDFVVISNSLSLFNQTISMKRTPFRENDFRYLGKPASTCVSLAPPDVQNPSYCVNICKRSVQNRHQNTLEEGVLSNQQYEGEVHIKFVTIHYQNVVNTKHI